MKQPTNVLLGKSELGKVKTGFHNLPPEGHTYGWQPEKDKHGAREVISNWEYHKPSGVQQPTKDFKALNKQSAMSGCTNAKDISKYRQTSDVRVKVKEGQKYYDIKLPPEEFVYGIPNRPSTPIKNVICNTYAVGQTEQLKDERDAVMKVLNENDNQPPVEKKQAKHNVNRKLQIEKNNFKLGKFKNVPSKIKSQIHK